MFLVSIKKCKCKRVRVRVGRIIELKKIWFIFYIQDIQSYKIFEKYYIISVLYFIFFLTFRKVHFCF